MPEPKVSVIVPVYKVEQYLAACVDSILGQSYPDFELILVDDGSPDRCGAMCDAYAEQDGRVRVIHKENGGLSDARNAGIEIADGEYLTFIDSDDIVSSDYLETLLNAAETCGADVAQGQYTRDLAELGTRPEGAETVVFRDFPSAFRSYLAYREINCLACSKLYRRELFRDIRFPVGRLYEDLLTVYKLVAEADVIASAPGLIYYYRKNPESITRRPFDRRYFEKPRVVDEMRDYLGPRAGEFSAELDYFQMPQDFAAYFRCLDARQEREYRRELTGIREDLRRMTLSPAWGWKRKLMRRLLLVSPALFEAAYLGFRRIRKREP